MKINRHFFKLFFYCTTVFLFIVIYDYFNRVNRDYKSFLLNIERVKQQQKMKYILQWTSSETVPFNLMGKGTQGFIDRKCQFTNCFVTGNKSLLGDYRNFDVIAFSGPDIAQYPIELPENRSPFQKYVFASIESSHYYPLCSDQLDNYFNWTWSFKLDSDVRWGYIIIRDLNKNIIGPKQNMNWLTVKEMKPVSKEFKETLSTKTKAAAWFVSNCQTNSRREILARKLQKELIKLNHVIDIYGECGKYTCLRKFEPLCTQEIKHTYYFYLSFENALSEDYVTEKLLHALQNNAIPIVYGGANYSRFMPEGAYLDAKKLSARALAKKMNQLIMNPEKYAEYFKWKNHYSYHKTDEDSATNEYCQMCELLNDKRSIEKESVLADFVNWWNIPKFCDMLVMVPSDSAAPTGNLAEHNNELS